MQHKVRLLASSALAVSLLAGAAHAQQASNTIEELVVTAEKREQSLQDVPVAISAFTAKQRDLVGINTIQDYTNFTPGLVYSTFSDRASVRGIGRLSNIHAVDAAVVAASRVATTPTTTPAMDRQTPMVATRIPTTTPTTRAVMTTAALRAPLVAVVAEVLHDVGRWRHRRLLHRGGADAAVRRRGARRRGARRLHRGHLR